MLTRVDVQSENPFYLNIRDARPTDSIIVEKIEGLDPPDIDLFMGDYARDGGFYSGRRVPPRTVTFTLQLNPNHKLNESVSGLRTMLYRAFLDPFATSDGLMILLKDDELPDRYIYGNVEKFDQDLFSDETTVQITMRCQNPYLLDYSPTMKAASGPTVPFEYKGSAESGIEMWATVSAATTTVVFDLNGFNMRLNYSFVEGDRIYINTNRGSRRIAVTRTVGTTTTTTDILYTLSRLGGSKWLEIHNRDNILQVYGASKDSVVANLTNLGFRAAHWGV